MAAAFIAVALQLAALTMLTTLEDRVTRKRDESGSVTIEQVIWAGAVIVIVGVVVTAIRAFVTSPSPGRSSRPGGGTRTAVGGPIRHATRAMGDLIVRVPARPRSRQDERGSVAIQMVFLMSVMFLRMFLGLQGALCSTPGK